MTIRPMAVSLPPDEEWVVIGYRSLDGAELELKQNWLIFSPGPEIRSVDAKALAKGEKALGIDIITYKVQQIKKALFAPYVVVAEKKISKGKILRAAAPKSLETSMPGVFKAFSVNTQHGTYGYIRIYTFYDENIEDFINGFISEFIRLAELLPGDGLIIDVRGNGGGFIYASEILLQLLTPRQIKPEPAQFINTPLTLDLCRRNPPDLSPWIKSIEQATETGATFSQGFPITPEEFCNEIGQRYYGPIVLITDALCYSATDIFAAGFYDHKIGQILGTSWNTGAGGANVWTHEDLVRSMGNSSLVPLTNGSGMRVSLRRLLRVHEHEGMPLEDLGVIPNYKHDMTKDDVLKGNIDLIDHAASILAGMPAYDLSLSADKVDGKIILNAESKNISRLDLFISDRPQQSLDVTSGSTQFVLEPSPGGTILIELRGFKDSDLVAIRREKVKA